MNVESRVQEDTSSCVVLVVSSVPVIQADDFPPIFLQHSTWICSGQSGDGRDFIRRDLEIQRLVGALHSSITIQQNKTKHHNENNTCSWKDLLRLLHFVANGYLNHGLSTTSSDGAGKSITA